MEMGMGGHRNRNVGRVRMGKNIGLEMCGMGKEIIPWK